MRNQTYTTRRGYTATTTWGRNRNVVRHKSKRLGSISRAMIVGILVLIIGLIYVAQGTKATNYDYELSAIEQEISELEAKKEDLAVEKARLTSIAAAEKSKVAMAMADGQVAGYAQE